MPQPHGGALIPGAGGGPQPGSGRPASEIRERMRGALAERIHIAEEIADNPQSAPADRMRALDFLAKHGMPVQQEISGPEGSPIAIEDKREQVKRLLKEKKLKVVKE